MNRIFGKNIFNYLYLAFIIELLLVFYLRNDAGFLVSPILMVASGMFIAYFPLLMMNKKGEGIIGQCSIDKVAQVKPTTFWLIFGAMILVYWTWSALLFHFKPIDINQSDIVPFIQEVYLVRLFRGEAVYNVFTGFNYGTFTPSYLPAHWSPFIIPYLLNIDLRWACVGIFSIATLIYTNYLWRIDKSKSSLIKILLPWVLLFSIYIKQPKDAAHTIEIMIMGYYLILGVFIFSNSMLMRAIGVILPLFSRYAFLFWLPVYALIQWLNSLKMFTSLLVWGIILVSIIFLPFIIQTPEMYKDFNGNYLHGIINEWQGQSWQKAGDRPFQLFQGMGVASWFYFWFDGALEDKIGAIKNALIMASVFFMLLQVVLVWRLNLKNQDKLVALFTLKAALTIFYVFVMVPYVYLNWVPLVISVVILSRVKNINA
jgi:hypothetical protein